MSLRLSLNDRLTSLLYTKFQRYYLLAVVVLLSTACSPLQLNPITPTPTGQHHPGQVVWHDLLTDNVGVSKRFYGQLFGWTFQNIDRYTVVLNDGVPIAGMVSDAEASKSLERSWWIIYVSIEDVDDTAKWVEAFGGQVIKGPGKMTDRGHYAMIKDSQGAPLMLLHSATGDPIPADPALNSWLWNELWTSDADAALEFYQPLGGYAADLVSSEENEDPYWVLVTDQRWQAGVTTAPFENIPPQWVPVVRVADPLAVADQVASLGGRVLIRPDHPLGNGDLALIEDPSGGIIMVESWDPDNLPTKEQ